VDIDLLKTFLEVYRTRHFGRAAENLFVTQSAVSARIRLLEEDLGVTLFTRARNKIDLTPEGQRFLRHAEGMLNAWNRARQEIILADEDRVRLAVGGMYSLWDIVLQDWLQRLCRRVPRISLLADADGPEGLVRKLLDGYLDIAFMFEPPRIAEVDVIPVAQIPLIMVAARPDLDVEGALDRDYIMVNWGTSFANAHARHFPDLRAPAIQVSMGRIALEFILSNGGSCYLAKQTVANHLKDRRLYQVKGAPVIERTAYAAYIQANDRRDTITDVLRLFESGAGKRRTPAGRK
jgi:DNA-binding transcriptional LysR family regulator